MVIRQILNCKKCGLHAFRSKVVLGRGDPTAKLLLIGESPGVSEDVIGMAFVGEAGKMLDQILGEAMIDIKECFFTNCVLCRACDGPMESNRAPTREEVKACEPNVNEIITGMNKLGTILLGKESNRYFRSKVKGLPFINIIHPSALLKQGGKFSSMYQYTINELIRFKERIGL